MQVVWNRLREAPELYWQTSLSGCQLIVTLTRQSVDRWQGEVSSLELWP